MADLYRLNGNGAAKRTVPEAAFPFLKEKHHVISLVGGGGKTTLMYFLAKQYAGRGFRTLVTTTTHICRPKKEVFAEDRTALERLWGNGSYAVIGTPAENGKLSMPDPLWLADCLAPADAVLIEADGAKRMPCKAPASFEPVLLPESDLVIGVAGLSALGRPMREVCFRPERAAKVLFGGSVGEARRPMIFEESGREAAAAMVCEHCLSEEDLAVLLSSTDGARKQLNGRMYYAVVNQCDSPAQREAGARILRRLRELGVMHAVMTGQMQK